MAGNGNGTTIIKRKKVVAGGGHHGGAWKVAYADFVTAMMAFFMLMWLLNATTEKQRKGLADYFSPTISINRVSGGGDKDLKGSSVFAEDTLPQDGTGATARNPAEQQQAQGADAADEGSPTHAIETVVLEETRRILLEKMVESQDGNSLLQHMSIRITDAGLVIELHDLPGAPLFTGVDEPADPLRRLTQVLAETGLVVENALSVEAFVATFPEVLAVNPAWTTSEARAQKVRVLLEEGGLPGRRIARVTAHADRKPAHENPMSPRNNRVEVIFLR
ncbi:flagellar motor protein MotB [Roseivivax isoporae]|uniref:Chemotaxis protein MotB n=1 Tax=Roseivivax isoporae LMG 25204 TaxID=1449351 RepID=X7FAD2_9RHOB|nr:flagellar motor protein MotB [Roseivivax isoporae]ETX29678.1 chemotaxis protein MotB [Roseivivax isoporae LMG 25204]